MRTRALPAGDPRAAHGSSPVPLDHQVGQHLECRSGTEVLHPQHAVDHRLTESASTSARQIVRQRRDERVHLGPGLQDAGRLAPGDVETDPDRAETVLHREAAAERGIEAARRQRRWSNGGRLPAIAKGAKCTAHRRRQARHAAGRAHRVHRAASAGAAGASGVVAPNAASRHARETSLHTTTSCRAPTSPRASRPRPLGDGADRRVERAIHALDRMPVASCRRASNPGCPDRAGASTGGLRNGIPRTPGSESPSAAAPGRRA